MATTVCQYSVLRGMFALSDLTMISRDQRVVISEIYCVITTHCMAIESCFNPLPDDKILDWLKLKQFADDNLKMAESSLNG